MDNIGPIVWAHRANIGNRRSGNNNGHFPPFRCSKKNTEMLSRFIRTKYAYAELTIGRQLRDNGSYVHIAPLARAYKLHYNADKKFYHWISQ